MKELNSQDLQLLIDISKDLAAHSINLGVNSLGFDKVNKDYQDLMELIKVGYMNLPIKLDDTSS